MVIKAIAAAFCIKLAGIYLLIIVPSKTPTKDEQTSAKEEPKKTESFELDCADNNIVVNCVLSPNSAIKTKKKVEIIIFSIKSS